MGKEKDFKRLDLERPQTVDIVNLVSVEDVDPLLFYKLYYFEVDKAHVLEKHR